MTELCRISRNIWTVRKIIRKIHFELSDELREKINSRLGFYFEHYGYQMQTDKREVV